ncbi:MAG: hypothetical protein QOI31_2320 [Solirubrobacterales bacterium]|jgi:hypothetical protein|nr:hypothetical protein [Solirubrobacterales bacterium]
MSDITRQGRPRRKGAALVIAALVVLAVAISPAIAGFKSGTYSGKTSQDANLQLSVNKSKTKVNVVFFEFIAPPCGGPGGTQYAGLEGKIKDSGKFNVPSPGDGFYGYVKGKFKGKSAEGTALYHFDAQGCDSGIVDWTAKKG